MRIERAATSRLPQRPTDCHSAAVPETNPVQVCAWGSDRRRRCRGELHTFRSIAGHPRSLPTTRTGAYPAAGKIDREQPTAIGSMCGDQRMSARMGPRAPPFNPREPPPTIRTLLGLHQAIGRFGRPHGPSLPGPHRRRW
jgi:hypothetical protein